MPNAITYLVITHDSRRSVVSKQTDLFGNADTADKYREFVPNLLADLASALGGCEAASIIARMENGTNTTKASGTITYTGLPIANETITIGGKVLTYKAASGNENEITIGADATATAVNTAAIINANSALKGLVLATSVEGVVTVACTVPGRIGNIITLAEAATNTAVSGTTLTGATATQQVAPITYVLGGV